MDNGAPMRGKGLFPLGLVLVRFWLDECLLLLQAITLSSKQSFCQDKCDFAGAHSSPEADSQQSAVP